MADDNPETSSRAASELGFMLARLDGDHEGAREHFAFAAEHGSGRTWVASTVALGHLSAADGDRQAATEAFRSVAAELSRAWNVEFGDDELRRAASAMAGLVLRPGWRRLIQRYRAAAYRGLRIRRRRFPGGWRARRA